MIRGFIFILLTFFITSASYGENKYSIYTDLGSDFCKDTEDPKAKDDDNDDYASYRCSGINEHHVNLVEGGPAIYISYGIKGKEQTVNNETMAGPSTVGQKMEWRMKVANGELVPFATIVRYKVSGLEDTSKYAQILVVTKLDQKNACHVSYVDALADKNANDTARKIADTEVESFVCGKDKAKNSDLSKYIYK